MALKREVDPFAELASAACNLLADTLGVRYCGAFAVRESTLRGASSEFMQLPEPLRLSFLDALSQTLLVTQFDEEDAYSNQMLVVPTDDELGGRAQALYFQETETVVFAVPPRDQPVPLAMLRRAAVSALPILYSMDDLARERRDLIADSALLRHVEELSGIGGWEQDLRSGRLRWSNAVHSIHGLEPSGDMSMERVLELYPSPAREKLTLEMERAAAEGGAFDLTTPIRTPSGDRRVVRTVGRSSANGTGRRLYGITEDVTKQMTSERRLWWAANHDPVTSLPNRLLFEDRLSVAIKRAERENATFALAIIELSDFARLYRHSGYSAPDKRMLDVAGRLGAVTRASDTVARLSINEFAVIFNGVYDNETLGPATRRLQDQIEDLRRNEVGGDGLVVSVGVAFFPIHASGPDELVRAAEMALSQARRKLDDPIIVFDRKIADDAAKKRETVLSRARDSLAKREFVPFYQPQIDIETNEVVGVEALVRWQTPDILLDAKDFAYALDDHEIGSRVGRAVLDSVIDDISKLRKITDRPFRVSINASRTEVLRNDFLDTFLDRTRNGNLRPNDFIIEITEDVIIGVDDRTLHDKISFLVSSGVEFSLDDFGTGYASLIHISSFPVKEIKIDKQFIYGIENDRRKRAIVKGVVQIARSMGLHVIAEGVETMEQQEVLRDVGCRYVQGYLYSFPVPFDQFAAMISNPH